MTSMFTDFWTLLEALGEHTLHTGDTVVCAEDPKTRTLGFVSVAPVDSGRDGHFWQISQPSFIASFDGTHPREAEIREAFSSAEGRMKFACSIPGQLKPNSLPIPAPT